MVHRIYLVVTAILTVVLPHQGVAETQHKFPERITVELSDEARQVLLEAPRAVMNEPPPERLRALIEAESVSSIEVEKYVVDNPEGERTDGGRDATTTYQAYIRYTPVTLSDSRQYRPTVLCVSHDGDQGWIHCEDYSWTRLQTTAMAKPIRFNGDLSDEQVNGIFEFVDDAGLVSTTDDQPVTAAKIYQILKYPHAGNRINVYVTTDRPGYTDVIYLKQVDHGDGTSGFDLTEFACAQPSSS